jgi:hypothetical protein
MTCLSTDFSDCNIPPLLAKQAGANEDEEAAAQGGRTAAWMGGIDELPGSRYRELHVRVNPRFLSKENINLEVVQAFQQGIQFCLTAKAGQVERG